MERLTSRERMLRAISCQETDRVPCCFMSNAVMRRRCKDDPFKLAERELALGLDPMLFVPTAPRRERPQHPDLRGLPVRLPAEVKIKTWREKCPGQFDILHKEYSTAAGELSTSVRLSDDWPHGDNLPFLDDYQVPRAIKPLVTGPADLNALAALLIAPAEEDVANFKQEAARARAFAQQHGILLAGGWGVGADMANWLCGMQNFMGLCMTDGDFATSLLELIHVWNTQRMEVVLSAPVDLYIRRAWYEGCDFITPRFYRQAVLPRLKREVALAHARGAKFGYICPSGTTPLLDCYLEAGIDVLLGIDPVQGTHTDMAAARHKAGKRLCLWGGVSAAITVELGTEEEVREAVGKALKTLGPAGMILSPIDNLTEDNAQAERNTRVFIDQWQKSAGR